MLAAALVDECLYFTSLCKQSYEMELTVPIFRGRLVGKETKVEFEPGSVQFSASCSVPVLVPIGPQTTCENIAKSFDRSGP